METFENEQYITFPISDLQDVQDNNTGTMKKETSNPISECIIQEVPITTINLTIDEDNPSTVPKKEKDSLNTGDDESMAVEALRQLGGMYPCFDNDKMASPESPNNLESQQSDSEISKFVCMICGKLFDTKMEHSNHMVCHQVDRPHTCRICGSMFRTKSSLQVHTNSAHQNAKIHKCTICGVDFQRPSSLSNHMKIHTYVAGRAITRLQNEQKSESQASTSVVTSVHDYDSVQWSMPVYSFNEQSSGSLDDSNDKLNLQEYSVIPSNSVNGEMAQIEYTDQTPSSDQQFLTISSYENANTEVKIATVQYNDSSIVKKIVMEVEPDKRVISPRECEYCDKQFQDSNHLASHQKTCIKRIAQIGGAERGNWGKHACSECGKKFTTKQKMFRHQWIHRKKTHSCEVCGNQFERQVELDEHRLSAHPGDSPFTCTECGKSFVSRQGLWEHGRTHAGSPAHFHCDKCSKTFTSRQGYLIHHRTHTGERPYGCKFCWKAFRDGGTLRKHERIHTGERPHVCPLCSRAFNQKVVLREHVRWVHAAAKNDTETTGPPFPCPLCGDLNQDRDELCAHIVKHSDKMIAEAKAKTSEPKKTSKTSKSKKKIKEPTSTVELKDPKLEEVVKDEEQIILAVSDPLEKTVEGQNVYIDSKQTYILVNAGKTSKVYTVADLKQLSSGQLERIKGNTIEICIEQEDNEEVEEDEEVDEQRKNTLRFMSKCSEDSSVLTIPNSQTNENFSSQIELVPENEVHEYVEQEDMDIMQVDGVQFEQDEDDANELIGICRVCGETGFNNKSDLMEHVKIHM